MVYGVWAGVIALLFSVAFSLLCQSRYLLLFIKIQHTSAVGLWAASEERWQFISENLV